MTIFSNIYHYMKQKMVENKLHNVKLQLMKMKLQSELYNEASKKAQKLIHQMNQFNTEKVFATNLNNDILACQLLDDYTALELLEPKFNENARKLSKIKSSLHEKLGQIEVAYKARQYIKTATTPSEKRLMNNLLKNEDFKANKKLNEDNILKEYKKYEKLQKKQTHLLHRYKNVILKTFQHRNKFLELKYKKIQDFLTKKTKQLRKISQQYHKLDRQISTCNNENKIVKLKQARVGLKNKYLNHCKKMNLKLMQHETWLKKYYPNSSLYSQINNYLDCEMGHGGYDALRKFYNTVLKLNPSLYNKTNQPISFAETIKNRCGFLHAPHQTEIETDEKSEALHTVITHFAQTDGVQMPEEKKAYKNYEMTI